MAPVEGEEDAPQVYDGEPLIKAAQELKEEGNALVKQRKYSEGKSAEELLDAASQEAVSCYERGVAVLDRGDGYPMLRQEVEAMVALKAVLYGNAAQCLLNLELFRRAETVASACLRLDEGNAKGLHRRSLAREALRDFAGALEDTTKLQALGGGALEPAALEARLAGLRAKKEALDKAKAGEEPEDEADTELVRMKERFDEVVEKYDLRDNDAASEVADWLASGEWLLTVRRVAQRWKMEEEDAEVFLRWIAKGLEFSAQTSCPQGAATLPSASLTP